MEQEYLVLSVRVTQVRGERASLHIACPGPFRKCPQIITTIFGIITSSARAIEVANQIDALKQINPGLEDALSSLKLILNSIFWFDSKKAHEGWSDTNGHEIILPLELISG